MLVILKLQTFGSSVESFETTAVIPAVLTGKQSAREHSDNANANASTSQFIPL